MVLIQRGEEGGPHRSIVQGGRDGSQTKNAVAKSWLASSFFFVAWRIQQFYNTAVLSISFLREGRPVPAGRRLHMTTDAAILTDRRADNKDSPLSPAHQPYQ